MSNLEQLMEAVEAAPQYDDSNWAQYQEAFWRLVDKGYIKTSACKFIADQVGLKPSDEVKLTRSAKGWKRNK